MGGGVTEADDPPSSGFFFMLNLSLSFGGSAKAAPVFTAAKGAAAVLLPLAAALVAVLVVASLMAGGLEDDATADVVPRALAVESPAVPLALGADGRAVVPTSRFGFLAGLRCSSAANEAEWSSSSSLSSSDDVKKGLWAAVEAALEVDGLRGEEDASSSSISPSTGARSRVGQPECLCGASLG